MRKSVIVVAAVAGALGIASVGTATGTKCGSAHLMGTSFSSITVSGVSCAQGKALVRIADSTPTTPIAHGKERVKYGPYQGLTMWMGAVPTGPAEEHDAYPVLNIAWGKKRVSAVFAQLYFN